MVHAVCEILAYVVVVGFELAALCAITRVARGWGWQSVGFAAFLGVYGLLGWLDEVAGVPFVDWAPIGFVAIALAFTALVFALSRDSPGRRVFLSIGYISYAAWYLPVFHLIAYRNVFGLAELPACLAGLAEVTVANLAYLFWLHRGAPRADSGYNWWAAACAAGMVTALLYVSGIWPISLLTAPPRYCASFGMASFVAWVGFPVLLSVLDARRRAVQMQHGLELMITEVKMRRAAIDLSRRIRHDERHHRAQVAEYLRAGEIEKALAYVEKQEQASSVASKERLVWCENETVNAILSNCARKAQAAGVSLEAKIDVRHGMALPDAELVAVLANLIENAAHGAEGARSKEQGASAVGVSVTMRQRDFGIAMMVANPVPEGFRLSPKGLPCAEPGIGMESIRQVVEKHHGRWDYALADGLLTCQVILHFS